MKRMNREADFVNIGIRKRIPYNGMAKVFFRWY